MRHVDVENLKGTEVLGIPVVSSSDVILIGEGTVLESRYIEKLKELNIESVYIYSTEENVGEPKAVYTQEETYRQAKEVVQQIFEKHVYKHNSSLVKVVEEAEKILNSVVDKPEVIDNLTEIRNISTDMYSHCINVCSMSTIMAMRLRMSDKQVRDIAMGAILHDIGLKYITVPYIDVDVEEMSLKAQEEYKKHTINGYSSIQDEQWLSDISKDIILLHHEREDGQGYPFHYTKEKIGLEAKLVAVCDDFDAMISGIGRRRMKIYEAIEYIKVNSGIIYDTAVAEKLLKTMAVYPVGTRVRTNENEIGIVIRQNTAAPERPVLKMLNYSNGRAYDNDIIKDLMKLFTLFIVDTID